MYSSRGIPLLFEVWDFGAAGLGLWNFRVWALLGVIKSLGSEASAFGSGPLGFITRLAQENV